MSASDPSSHSSASTTPVDIEEVYPCVGICMADPESGLCQGCGRPLAEPETPETDSPA